MVRAARVLGGSHTGRAALPPETGLQALVPLYSLVVSPPENELFRPGSILIACILDAAWLRDRVDARQSNLRRLGRGGGSARYRQCFSTFGAQNLPAYGDTGLLYLIQALPLILRGRKRDRVHAAIPCCSSTYSNHFGVATGNSRALLPLAKAPPREFSSPGRPAVVALGANSSLDRFRQCQAKHSARRKPAPPPLFPVFVACIFQKMRIKCRICA